MTEYVFESGNIVGKEKRIVTSIFLSSLLTFKSVLQQVHSIQACLGRINKLSNHLLHASFIFIFELNHKIKWDHWAITERDHIPHQRIVIAQVLVTEWRMV